MSILVLTNLWFRPYTCSKLTNEKIINIIQYTVRNNSTLLYQSVCLRMCHSKEDILKICLQIIQKAVNNNMVKQQDTIIVINEKQFAK